MQAEQKAAAALEDAREHQCETHERLLQSLDFESGTGEAAALYQRRSALESVCTRLRTQQAQLTGAALAIGDPMALKSEHAQLLEQRDALERQYAAIALAIETLGRADAELQSRFSPQLAQKAADYMDYLTDGRYDELVLARDLSAKARSTDDPTPRDTAYLSAGTADLLYLSVRLALCELTCPADDPCPLVLDDTLVNFDDARAGRGRSRSTGRSFSSPATSATAPRRRKTRENSRTGHGTFRVRFLSLTGGTNRVILTAFCVPGKNFMERGSQWKSSFT